MSCSRFFILLSSRSVLPLITPQTGSAHITWNRFLTPGVEDNIIQNLKETFVWKKLFWSARTFSKVPLMPKSNVSSNRRLLSRSHSGSFCFHNFLFLNKDRGKWVSSGSSQISNVRLEEVMRRNENAKTWKHKKNTMQICKKVRMLKTQICRNDVVATPNPQSLSHSWIS